MLIEEDRVGGVVFAAVDVDILAEEFIVEGSR